MNRIIIETVPRLAPGCRLGSGPGQQDMLLVPEGALRLKGPARMIVERCDGQRTVGTIIDELRRLFPSEDGAKIEADVVDLLTRLRDRGVIEGV
jgi:pyrroloquinoline quinone biosynthesis protein D